MNSVDPRINRLLKARQPADVGPKAPLDQFGTFEVFVKARGGKPFQHEGIVHAPDAEMAFVLAKETFTRRFTCVSLFVADTRQIFVSPLTEGSQSVFDILSGPPGDPALPTEPYEVFHLYKRGKQHVHAGTVNASSPIEAMQVSRSLQESKTVYSVWVIRMADIRFTRPDEEDMWETLPEKKFRDAVEYKGGDRLKTFLRS